MRDDQRMRFEDLFLLPLDDLDAKLEFVNDENRRNAQDQFTDFSNDLHEAMVEYYVNCFKAAAIADSNPRACRLGYDSCQSKYRKILRENFKWQQLFIIGRIGSLLGDFMESHNGRPTVVGIGPGGVNVVGGDGVPPEIMKQLQAFAADMAKKIIGGDNGTLPGDLGELTKRKPEPDRKKPAGPTVDEISREADRIIDQALAKPPAETKPPENGDAKK